MDLPAVLINYVSDTNKSTFKHFRCHPSSTSFVISHVRLLITCCTKITNLEHFTARNKQKVWWFQIPKTHAMNKPKMGVNSHDTYLQTA
jgi:hypothetical protein